MMKFLVYYTVLRSQNLNRQRQRRYSKLMLGTEFHSHKMQCERLTGKTALQSEAQQKSDEILITN